MFSTKVLYRSLFASALFNVVLHKASALLSSWDVPTAGGNDGGNNCVFPFVYRGYSWDSCIETSSDPELVITPWCATTSDYDTDGKWAYCLQTVRVYDAPEGYTHCTFPYTYNGQQHYGCMRNETVENRIIYETQPWCGVVSDVDANPSLVGKCIMQYKAYNGDLAFSLVDESPWQHDYGECDGPQLARDTLLPFEAINVNHYGCFQYNDSSVTPWCYTDQTWGGIIGTCDNVARNGRVYSPGDLIEPPYDYAAWHLIDGWATPMQAASTAACATEMVHPWLVVELPFLYRVTDVQIMNIENQNPAKAMFQNQKNFDILVGSYFNQASLASTLSLFQTCGSQGSTSMAKGRAVDSWTYIWPCPGTMIGRYVLVYGTHATDVISLCFSELNVFGDFIGELNGMPSPRRTDSVVHTNPSLPSGPVTFLFRGIHTVVLDDGVLTAFQFLAQTADPLELQIWRDDASTPGQHVLVYSKSVTGIAGTVSHVDVASDGFDVLLGDLVGVSFSATSPTPLTDITCPYTDHDAGAHTQTTVLTHGTFTNIPGISLAFSDSGTCKDYLVTASVRYYACRSNPCINGGRCEEIPVSQPRNSFLCHCQSGYRGTFCQHKVDNCEYFSVVCQNGGTCESDIRDLYGCRCPAGFYGEYCENAYTPCQDHRRGYMRVLKSNAQLSDPSINVTCWPGVRRHLLCAGICIYQTEQCNGVQYTADTSQCCVFLGSDYHTAPAQGTDLYELMC